MRVCDHPGGRLCRMCRFWPYVPFLAVCAVINYGFIYGIMNKNY